jgi:hypothetical protein
MRKMGMRMFLISVPVYLSKSLFTYRKRIFPCTSPWERTLLIF